MQEKGEEILNKRSENTIEPERLKLNIELENLVSNEGILTGDISQQSNSSSIFRKNDILFGRLRPYLNKWWYATDDGVKSGEIWAIYPKEPNHSLFIYYLIQTERFLYFANISSGTRMPRASWEIITDKTFLIPAPNEQKMIARLLHNLEKIITLEQEKLKLIKSLKTFLLDSLYTNKTSSPLLRFQKFSESWKEIKLKKISNITMGQSPKSKNYTDNPNDKILVQGNTDLKNNLVSPRVWTTQITKVASKGDIILTVRAPVGEVAVSQYDVVLGRGVASLSGNYFVFQLLLQMKEKNYWRKYSTGSTFESINSDDIKNAKVKIPSIEEQEKIGGLLHSIDKILILEQEKLKKYNCVKQLLLNSLFI